jgi:multiple antibiotic resistance protein
MNAFWLCFVPLFVAVDAIGILPLFVGLTEGLEDFALRRVIVQSVLTATTVALAFVFFGASLLRLLGITVPDFMVAGGALLFAISLKDLLVPEQRLASLDREAVGAVPLGVPLLAGPAVLTTCILLVDQFGAGLTTLAVVLNLGLAALVFAFARRIRRVLGGTGIRIVQRVTLVLLASIAVMTIRRGLEAILQSGAFR